MTDSEIALLEASLLKQQLGLQENHKYDQVLKILNFYPNTAANVICKTGTAISRIILSDLRDKPKRNFYEYQPSLYQTSTEQTRLAN